MFPIENAKAGARRRGRPTAWKPLLALLAIPAINVVYVLQNQRPGGHIRSLETEVDRQLPFIPEFALPYAIWYPFLFIVFVLILRKDKREYYRTLLAMCFGLLLSNLVFFLFQTTVTRPEVEPDGFFHRLIAFVYVNDQPYNCFPSVHVMTTALMVYGSRALGWGAKIPIAIVAAAIIASTVFIKQHVIADVLGGLLAAQLVYWLAGEIMPRLSKGTSAFRRRLAEGRSVSGG